MGNRSLMSFENEVLAALTFASIGQSCEKASLSASRQLQTLAVQRTKFLRENSWLQSLQVELHFRAMCGNTFLVKLGFWYYFLIWLFAWTGPRKDFTRSNLWKAENQQKNFWVAPENFLPVIEYIWCFWSNPQNISKYKEKSPPPPPPLPPHVIYDRSLSWEFHTHYKVKQ